MRLFVLSIIFPLLLTSPVWKTNFEEAKAEAVKNDKYILINFSGSDWCIPCIKMEKGLFDTETFCHFAANDLVLVKADFPRLKKNQLSKKQTALNEALAEKYNPHGTFPLTLLVDKEGKVLKEWEGLPGVTAEGFVDQLKAAEHAH